MAALCESDAECCGDLSSLSSSETGTEATERESTSCVSLLDRLQSPKPSELACKRKVDHNAPPIRKEEIPWTRDNRPQVKNIL